MRVRTEALPTALIGLVLLACGSESAISIDAATPPIVTAKRLRDLDVLFVIDNTASGGVQAPLAQGFASFSEALGVPDGDAPNLQIGVVSTDVGAGDFGISGCAGDGDNGRLQATPRGSCEAPRDRFIVNRGLADGSRVTNYEGTLTDTFNCISRLGVTGCAFQQNLESMRRALDGSNAQNLGFVRNEAMLAVILLVDEDDCSAFDNTIFSADPSNEAINSELGFLSNFRCFEFGVECQPDEPREVGSKSACAPRESSPYLVPPSEYVSWLRGLKERDDMVAAFGFSAGVEPVVVNLNSAGEPFLEAACSGIHGISPSAIRIDAFLQGVSSQGAYPKCQDDFAASLAEIAESIQTSMTHLACLSGALRDSKLEVPGVQPSCEVVDVANLGRTDEERVALSACADSQDLPCYRFEEAEARCGVGGLALVVDRPATELGAALSTLARCEGVL